MLYFYNLFQAESDWIDRAWCPRWTTDEGTPRSQG